MRERWYVYELDEWGVRIAVHGFVTGYGLDEVEAVREFVSGTPELRDSRLVAELDREMAGGPA